MVPPFFVQGQGEWEKEGRHEGGGTRTGFRGDAWGSFVRLRTHEFLSRRGKEPKAAGGRRGFHAARRPPDPPQTNILCRWSLAGAPRTGFPPVPHERPR